MIHRLLVRVIEALVVVIATVIVSVVSIEVVLRYLFGISLILTEELSRYLMVWLVFLGAALAVNDDAHIRITFFTDRLPGGVRSFFQLTARLLVLCFSAIIIVQGVKILPAQLQQQTTTLPVSIFWFYLAIPCGSALMTLFLVPKIGSCIRELGKKTAGEGDFVHPVGERKTEGRQSN
jgi:TRAP-type transport system small permease protein